jgi:hypothetical protein
MSSLRKELQARAGDLTDVTIKKSRFGGATAFFRGKKEFAHFHAGNEIDIRLTKPNVKKLKPDYRLQIDFPYRDWVVAHFETEADLDFVMKLLEIAYKANRA